MHYVGALQNSLDEALPVSKVVAAEMKLTTVEKNLLQHIGFDIVTIDQLIERSSLNSSQVATSLFNLELKGAITHSDWGYEAINNV
jgi:DNA processing protein